MSDRGSGRPSRPGFTVRGAIVAAALSIVAGPLAPAAQAVTGLELSTPFPAVVVEPGGTATFKLAVDVTDARRVDLAVEGVPTGWETRIRGGGLVVDGAFVTPDEAPDLTLSVDVPDEATAGSKTITVKATSGALTETLVLDLRVQAAAEGAVSLESDFPQLTGPADATYTFNLKLTNDTPGEITFALAATGPDGWGVNVVPTGQNQATSTTVAAGGSGRLTVTVAPGDNVEAGTYPVKVEVVGGGKTVDAELSVVVTGTYRMSISTPTDNLAASANAGSPTQVTLEIQNTGTAPLVGVQVAGTGPTNWDIAFDLETVASIGVGQTGTVVATITPTSDAVAGDYVVTIRGTTEETSGNVQIRVRVETSGFWWIVGVGLILATFGGLYWVFRTYGRR